MLALFVKNINNCIGGRQGACVLLPKGVISGAQGENCKHFVSNAWCFCYDPVSASIKSSKATKKPKKSCVFSTCVDFHENSRKKLSLLNTLQTRKNAI